MFLSVKDEQGHRELLVNVHTCVFIHCQVSGLVAVKGVKTIHRGMKFHKEIRFTICARYRKTANVFFYYCCFLIDWLEAS